MSNPTFEPLKIVVRGKHDSGKTTAASLIKNYFEECGYLHVTLTDAPPLSPKDKPEFMDRFNHNRHLRPVVITVEIEE